MKLAGSIRIRVLTLIFAVLFFAAAFGPDVFSDPPRGKWTLAWSDEFNAPNGSPVDAAKWVHETGGDGWGNHELEYYTDRQVNSFHQDGHLVIQAQRESFAGKDGVTRPYTSARLRTLGKFDFTYGRVEARIQIPFGKGIWPAFWMMGTNFPEVGWPTCGEVDLMENFGKLPSQISGSVHGPGYSGGQALEAKYVLPRKRRFADNFHVFAIEWEPEVMRFYVDQHLYARRTPKDLPAGSKWVFDHPFFLLMNVAVGGDPAGSPDATTVFPQTMRVDYVRVYQRSTNSSSKPR